MAYTTEDLEKQALKAIEEEKLVFIDEVVSHLPCTNSTFYNKKMEQMETIKSALMKNKVSVKKKLRRNWEKEDTSATTQIALYKLLGNEDERDALNGVNKDQSHSGEIKIVVERKTLGNNKDG